MTVKLLWYGSVGSFEVGRGSGSLIMLRKNGDVNFIVTGMISWMLFFVKGLIS